MHIAELSRGSNGLTCAVIRHNAWHLWAGQVLPPPSSAPAWSQWTDLLQEVGASWDESTPHGGYMTSLPLKFSLGHIIQEITSSF